MRCDVGVRDQIANIALDPLHPIMALFHCPYAGDKYVKADEGPPTGLTCAQRMVRNALDGILGKSVFNRLQSVRR